jgi:plasmid maintenance system antidote protein VapI
MEGVHYEQTEAFTPIGWGSMTHSTIARLVAVAGGPEAFAAAIRVKPRFVYYLLAGKRNLSPRTEELARKLAEELGVEIQT